MSRPLLVEGQFEPEVDSQDSLREALVKASQENARLERELEQTRSDLRAMARKLEQSAIPQRHLRRILKPLHDALKEVFGELDPTLDDEKSPYVETVTSATQGSDTIWRDRIAKLGGQAGRILEVLLEGGGPMSLNQIRSATKGGGATSARLSELVARNWVVKVGHGNYALRRQ